MLDRILAQAQERESRDSLTSGYLSKRDRQAFAWVWNAYIHKYILQILVVFSLVLIYSSSMVAFISLLNNNISSLFNPEVVGYGFAPSSLDQEALTFDILVLESANSSDERAIFSAKVQSGTLTVEDFDGQIEIPESNKISLNELRAFLGLSQDQILKPQMVLNGNVQEVKKNPTRVFVELLFLLIVATFIRVLSLYASSRIAERITALASYKIRRDLINTLFKLDMVYFNSTQSGAVLMVLSEFVQGMQIFFSTQLINAARAATTIIGIMLYLLWVHPGLFLIVAIIFPLVYIVIRSISARVREIFASSLQVLNDFLNHIENAVSGMQTIKLSNQSERASQELINDAHAIAKIQIRMSRFTTLVTPIIDLLTAIAVVMVVALGSYAVMSNIGGLTSTTLITFVIGLALVFAPATRLSGFNAAMITALVGLSIIKEVMELKPTIVNRTNALKRIPETPSISFSDVTFSYSPDNAASPQIYNRLNLEFKANKTSAVVGPTGSGKSTLITLMTRLYEASQGQVSIGGVDVRDLDLDVLRSSFSIISQDTFVFAGTIEENVRYVDPSANDEEVREALCHAQLEVFAAERVGQSIGARGSMLSGGQRQRIGIARAFLRDAPILILDEPTSALDSKTEAKVNDALGELAKGKTTITIAHRLKTIEAADEIFVLDNGTLIENGNHEQLMKNASLYAAMYMTQNPEE